MKNDTGAIIILIVLIVSDFLLIAYKLAELIFGAEEEVRNVHAERNRSGNETDYHRLRRKARLHSLSMLPTAARRGVSRIFQQVFRDPKHAKLQDGNDALPRLLAPSVIGICICAVCLCGASWAWFTASSSTGMAAIQAATYTVSVTATQDGKEISFQKKNALIEIALDGDREYRITITPHGTASSGYCKVHFEDADYYTEQLVSGSISFTVHTSKAGKLTITPEWGYCAFANAGNTIKNGSMIGSNAESNSSEDPETDAEIPDSVSVKTSDETSAETKSKETEIMPETEAIPEETEILPETDAIQEETETSW